MRGWEKYVRRVEPYVPGEQPKGNRLIKLNTNENPYPPSPKAVAALQAMEMDALRKYPDPAAAGLKRRWRITMVLRQTRFLPGLARMMFWGWHF